MDGICESVAILHQLWVVKAWVQVWECYNFVDYVINDIHGLAHVERVIKGVICM